MIGFDGMRGCAGCAAGERGGWAARLRVRENREISTYSKDFMRWFAGGL